MKHTKSTFKQRLSSLAVLMLLPFLLFIVSCSDDEDDPSPADEVEEEVEENEEVLPSIVELAQGSQDLSMLVTALTNYDDLVAALSDTAGNYTVFAPTNTAFETLLPVLGYTTLGDIPEDLLKQVLQYHVISGTVTSGDLSDGQTSPTLLADESITVSINGSTVMINMSTVVTADVAAANGVVHIIDAVLVPSFVPTNDIVEVASGSDDLSILVTALSKFPDLVEALSDNTGEFTVFAPTNQAFLDLLGVVGQTELDDIPESVLRRLLEYHVVSGTVARSMDLTDGDMVPTLLADESVTVSINGGDVGINNASVVTADISTVNGVVHIIDAVLAPSLEASIINTVVEPAYFNTEFSILTEAVVKAGLVETLINPEATLTVFAPTNAAFENADITTLDGLDADALTPILLYHVLGIEADAATVGGLGTGSAVTTLGGDVYLSINESGIFLNGTTQVVATDIEADNGVVHVIDRTLLPPANNVVEIAVAASQAAEGAEFGQLVAALTAVQEDMNTSQLITILSSDDPLDGAPFTVFAPTDAAFNRLYAAAGVADFSALVDALGIATIETVLQYHVIGGTRVFSTDLPNLESNTVNTLAGSFTLDLATLTIMDTDAALTVGTEDASIVTPDILGTNGVIHVIDEVILP